MLFSYCSFQPNRIRCQRDEHSTLKLLLYLMMMQLIIQSFPGIFIHILYELIDLIDMYLSIQLLHHHILKLNYS